jgi:uncharacterized protein YuzE
MRVTYHEMDDTLYLRMDEAPVSESQEVLPGLVVDFNESGQAIGIEMQGVKACNPLVNPRSIHFEVF